MSEPNEWQHVVDASGPGRPNEWWRHPEHGVLDMGDVAIYLNALEARATATEAERKQAAEMYVIALDVAEQTWRKELAAAEAERATLRQLLVGYEDFKDEALKVVSLTAKLAAIEERLQVAVAGLTRLANHCDFERPDGSTNPDWAWDHIAVSTFARDTLAALDAARDGTTEEQKA